MATDICLLVGQRIRKLRLANGWTQTYLSVHAGVGRNYISDVELGKKEIGLAKSILVGPEPRCNAREAGARSLTLPEPLLVC